VDVATLVFLSSGLFLGWSLGANDGANVFGTAVGTRMVRFRTAAFTCSVFVILGAVVSGAGASHTLSRLGSVNAIAGAFMVALAAGLAVYLMIKTGISVSTTQAIVGAIVGWNVFSGALTDPTTLITLVSTWVICPVLSGGIAALLYKLVAVFLRTGKLHLLTVDAYTRAGLILAGAFGAYSLGANNIANVMGVFVPVSPFTPFRVGEMWTVSSAQQLFLLGGLAIATGVFTYSRGVMMTVGRNLARLSPVAAFVVVVAQSVVLFLFASQGLEALLARAGLPTIPLVPVSSSQAVIGAIIGVGLTRGGRDIRFRLLGSIALGWVLTPIIAGVICFVALFFLQNVFNQQVYKPQTFELSPAVISRIAADGVDTRPFADLAGRRFATARGLADVLAARADLSARELRRIADYAVVDRIEVDAKKLRTLEQATLSAEQIAAVRRLDGKSFRHRWMFAEALARESPSWRALPPSPVNHLANRALDEKRRLLYNLFRVETGP